MNRTTTSSISLLALSLILGFAPACGDDGDATATDSNTGGSVSASGGSGTGGSSVTTGGASSGGAGVGGSAVGGSGATSAGGSSGSGGFGAAPAGGGFPFGGEGGLPFAGAPSFSEQECPAVEPAQGTECTSGFPPKSCPYDPNVCQCSPTGGAGSSASGTWNCSVLADCGSDVSGQSCNFGAVCSFDGMTCDCQPQIDAGGPGAALSYVCE